LPSSSSLSFPLLLSLFLFSTPRRPPRPTLFPYTTLFRSLRITSVRVNPMQGGRVGPARTLACDSLLVSGGWTPSLHLFSHTRGRSEEHTSELQSRENLVCRLLLEKKKKNRM